MFSLLIYRDRLIGGQYIFSVVFLEYVFRHFFFQIAFEAITGDSWKSDIALDEIMWEVGHCGNFGLKLGYMLSISNVFIGISLSDPANCPQYLQHISVNHSFDPKRI